LNGRLFSVKEDLEAMVRRAEEIEKGDLYFLRSRKL